MRKAIIWIFALILLLYTPISYPYGCPYIRNETFDNSGNWSLGTGCTITGGQLSCSNPSSQTKFLPQLPNMSIDKSNFTVSFSIRINSSADTTEHIMLCADNFTSASCGGGDGDQRRTGLRSGNPGAGVQVVSPDGVIKTFFDSRDTAWNKVDIRQMTNLSWNWTRNGTLITNPVFSTLQANVTQILITTGTYTMEIDNLTVINNSAVCQAVADTTPPSITYYNLTSSDNGCENWNTNKSNACSTSSVTPTVQFNTSEDAWCAIAGSSKLTAFDINYTDMTSARNCTGDASGEGTTEHFCTLNNIDELVYDTSYLFISCKDANNNQNRTSTSGALKLSINGLESAGRNSIGLGVQNALLSGYTTYTDFEMYARVLIIFNFKDYKLHYKDYLDLQIYARNLSNSQVRGTFDRAAKKGNKMWAFNRIGASDSYVNMFNMTPVLYTFEFANKTSEYITNQTERLINATK